MSEVAHAKKASERIRAEEASAITYANNNKASEASHAGQYGYRSLGKKEPLFPEWEASDKRPRPQP